MPDKASKKKPEIPQPRTDIILPDGTADSGEREMRRAPAPHGEPEQKEL